MPIQATANLSIQLPSTPSYSVAWVLQADAYDRASVTVQKSKTGTLELQPGKATEVLLLVIQSSVYSPITANPATLSFSFAGTSWPLTQPQVVSGPFLMNAITHAGPGNPNTLIIDNTNGAGDVSVDVLILRTAITIS